MRVCLVHVRVSPLPPCSCLQPSVSRSGRPIVSSQSMPLPNNLKRVLSLSTPGQPSWCHRSVSSPSSSPPVVRSTRITKQSDVYDRLIAASSAAAAASNVHDRNSSSTVSSSSTITTLSRNIFTPTICIDSIKDDNIKKRLKAIAAAVQRIYKQHIEHKHHELECDHVFAIPLDGFGVDGVQLYFKVGKCVTWLHDELLWYVMLCSCRNVHVLHM